MLDEVRPEALELGLVRAATWASRSGVHSMPRSWPAVFSSDLNPPSTPPLFSAVASSTR
jgi:hypothetical protein